MALRTSVCKIIKYFVFDSLDGASLCLSLKHPMYSRQKQSQVPKFCACNQKGIARRQYNTALQPWRIFFNTMRFKNKRWNTSKAMKGTN
jgi:hypothetical protein